MPKISRSLCSKDLYCAFLKVTSQRYSALSLSEVAPISLSHDSISRWLEEAHIKPKDIWNEVKNCVLSSSSGIIVADETVLNKNRSNKIGLVRWQYSGTVHDNLRGIGMLNFLWVDENRDVCPMDFRIWEPKEDGQTKNDQFREMLKIAKRREVKPEAVVADSWYGSLDNCKCIRDLGWNWVIGLRKNRVVGQTYNRWWFILSHYSVLLIILLIPAFLLYEILQILFVLMKGALKQYLEGNILVIKNLLLKRILRPKK